MEAMEGMVLRGDETTWRLGRAIGEGRYGVVFEATDDSKRRAAVKCLRSEFSGSDLAVKRMVRELAALCELHHQAFPTVFDQGLASGGEPFIVTQLLTGETLEAKRLRAGGRLDVVYVLECANQVLQGLEHAHAARIIHRDICPNNLFATSAGEFKILDLGLCKAIEDSGALSF